jgi:hypothetical protein
MDLYPHTPDLAPADPAFFVTDFQDANKNYFFSAYYPYFLQLHLQHFSKIKSHKEVTKQ